jgi:hypothetical protein
MGAAATTPMGTSAPIMTRPLQTAQYAVVQEYCRTFVLTLALVLVFIFTSLITNLVGYNCEWQADHSGDQR